MGLFPSSEGKETFHGSSISCMCFLCQSRFYKVHKSKWEIDFSPSMKSHWNWNQDERKGKRRMKGKWKKRKKVKCIILLLYEKTAQLAPAACWTNFSFPPFFFLSSFPIWFEEMKRKKNFLFLSDSRFLCTSHIHISKYGESGNYMYSDNSW